MPDIYKSRYLLPAAISDAIALTQLDGLTMAQVFARLGIRWQGVKHGQIVRELAGLMVAAGYRFDGRIWAYKRGKRKTGIGKGRYA